MSITLLVLALLAPLLAGASLLAACGTGEGTDRGPGMLPWTLGAGFVAGVLVLTSIMRIDAWIGVPFGIASIGGPVLALTAIFAWMAKRRGVAPARAWAASLRTLAGQDLAKPARLAWLALVAWIAVRLALLLAEVALRPLYAWDAWSVWATKAKVFYAMRTVVPFADLAGWTSATTPVWFDAAPLQSRMLPLLQAWIATAIGAWDDASVALPWWLFLVALILVVYGEIRRRGAPPLHALVAAWLAGSLPLLGMQVALAGYADLPLAAAFTLGALAGVRAVRTRVPADIVAAGAALASLALMKSSGWAWIVVALPGLVAVALPRRWHRRIGVLLVVAAIAVVGIAARFPNLAFGPVSFDYAPVWETLASDGVLLANWHLLAFGIIGTILLRRRRLVDAEMAPLTLILAAGSIWIAALAAFPALRLWGADFLGLNRAILVLAPFAIAWMAVAILDAPAEAVESVEAPADAAPAQGATIAPSPEPTPESA
ncbi:MAG: hypothetical protein ABI585_04550 [Betaproteobacteria bacterium]